VIEVLPTVSFTGPRGATTMNKQHHAPLTMYLGQVQSDGTVKVAATFKDVDPGDQCPKLK
jgi:branched-chain amino acid transport system substrate-binding protein